MLLRGPGGVQVEDEGDGDEERRVRILRGDVDRGRRGRRRRVVGAVRGRRAPRRSGRTTRTSPGARCSRRRARRRDLRARWAGRERTRAGWGGASWREERRDSAGRGRLEAHEQPERADVGRSSEPDRAGAAPATPLAGRRAHRDGRARRGAARGVARDETARGVVERKISLGKSRLGYQKVHDRIRASEIRAESTDPRSKATRAIRQNILKAATWCRAIERGNVSCSRPEARGRKRLRF